MSGITSLSQDYAAYERRAQESGAPCTDCLGDGRNLIPWHRLPKEREALAALPTVWEKCQRCDGTGIEPVMTRDDWDYDRHEARGEI